MISEREIAFKALQQILIEKKYSNLVLKNMKANTPFITQLVYGTLRNSLLLKSVIEKYCDRMPDRRIVVLLQPALYELLMMEGENYAIVNEWVQLSKTLCKGSYGSLVNAILRKVTKKDLECEDAALRYSHPQWLYKMWCAHYGQQNAEKIMACNQKEGRVALRINDTLCTEEELLQDRHFTKGTLEGCYYYEGNVIQSEAFKHNKVIVQSESSMLAVNTLDVKEHMRLLDLCAAPGSKSIQMAMAMKGSGEVIANDLYDFRVKLIEENAKRYGCTNIKTTCNDGLKIQQYYEPQTFDRILLDAPCSGLGTLSHKPEIRLTTTDKDLDDVVALQKQLLKAVCPLLKKGGKMVYSTCTLNKKENEKQIESFLKEHDDFILLSQKTVFPWEMGSDGFFVALLEKKTMIRLATINDLPQMLDVYETAKTIMRKSGNCNQWINGYPSADLLLDDINSQNSYLIMEDDEIMGAFTFIIGKEPTYWFLEDGTWLNNKPYGVIHRVASANKTKGILHTALAFAFSQIDNIRIDTHEDNKIMQRLLEKEGFLHCGTIYLKNGDPRLAYHKEMK